LLLFQALDSNFTWVYFPRQVTLAERQLRQALAENNQTIFDQKGKPTQIPTMRWVFQLFEGIDVLIIWQNDQVLMRQLLNLRPIHTQILRLFGKPVQNCYFLDPQGAECGQDSCW
jgi:hypothetical protein